MDDTIILEASLANPSDSTEVNVVAAVAAVGKTHRLASGQIIKWTSEFLRENAHTFVGKPVNIKLDPNGKATGHSRLVIGAIKDAVFDEAKQAVVVTAALWEHYEQKTVEKIRNLYAKGELKVSMELKYPKDSMTENADGSHTPTVGTFSGMGFVGQAGDPRSMVYLMAALKADEDNKQETSVNDVLKEIAARLMGTYKDPAEEEEFDPKKQDGVNAELSAAHEGSYEWLARSLQEHLSAGKSADAPTYHYIVATYSNYAIYQEGADYFRIDFKRSGDKLNFGEPQEVDPVYQPTVSASAEESGVDSAANTGNPNQGEENTMNPEELKAAQDDQIAELKASLDAANVTLNEMKANQDARDEADKAKARADERMVELEKIVPVKDELKAALHENLGKIDDAAYEALKATFAASAELRAGIAPSDEKITNPDPTPNTKDSQKVPEADMKQFQEEAKAQFGTGQKSEDKE